MKKEYRKPKLNVVDLVTEEVLTTGCKTGSSAGQNYNPCLSGTTGCRELGS